jgi:cation/acetate symporter
MSVGLAFTMFYIVGNRFFGMPAWFFGISAQGIGTIGMVLNLVVVLVVSRMTPPPPQEIQDLVQSIRIPRGAGGASAH